MCLLLKWPAGQWGSRQEGVQMSRKIVYVQCIFITQKWSKHLFFAVMRHCKERSIVYLALLGLHLETLPEAQRKQDIVWVWKLVSTFAILYTLSSYSSTTISNDNHHLPDMAQKNIVANMITDPAISALMSNFNLLLHRLMTTIISKYTLLLILVDYDMNKM